LVTVGLDGYLGDHGDVVYVLPLKALSNNIGKNEEAPLVEFEALATRPLCARRGALRRHHC
jgi:Lhr-like helicase